MLVMSYGYCSSLKLALPYLHVCVIDFGHSDIDKYTYQCLVILDYESSTQLLRFWNGILV